jgi:hypothetical protein
MENECSQKQVVSMTHRQSMTIHKAKLAAEKRKAGTNT